MRVHCRREAGSPRSCSDPFAFASFLAFTLALANLVMNMNGRRRRRAAGCEENRPSLAGLVDSTAELLAGLAGGPGGQCGRAARVCRAGAQLHTRHGEMGRLVAELGGQLLDPAAQVALAGWQNCRAVHPGCPVPPPPRSPPPPGAVAKLWDIVLDTVTGHLQQP